MTMEAERAALCAEKDARILELETMLEQREEKYKTEESRRMVVETTLELLEDKINVALCEAFGHQAENGAGYHSYCARCRRGI